MCKITLFLFSRPLLLMMGGLMMSVELNDVAQTNAKQLIGAGKCVLDDRDEWGEHKPTAEQENRFIKQYGFNEYSKWYLGVDTKIPKNKKGRYKFPYGDFDRVHRCGVIATETRAGHYNYKDIEDAAVLFHGMIMLMELK